MSLLFSTHAWEDYLRWQKTNKKILKRVHDLIKDISRSPYQGIGKPQPLKHAFSVYWSRRLTDEHRLVYRVENNVIKIAQLRYHYE